MKHVLHMLAFAALLFPHLSAREPERGGQGIQFLPTDRKPPSGKPMNDAELRAMRDHRDFGGFAPEGSAPRGWDILEYSDFLAFAGTHVILPKGSVVHVPEELKQHSVEKPEGSMIGWGDFVQRHRGLITIMPVTMKQVTGEEAIPAERMEAALKTRCIVVAAYEGSPITVLKPAASADAKP